MRRHIILVATCLLMSSAIYAQKIDYQTDTITGAISKISFENDAYAMNWILRADNSQYKWIGKQYGWGLGFFSMNGKRFQWDKQTSIKGNTTYYRVGDITVSVKRVYNGLDLTEDYTFKNESHKTLNLTDVGIHTPFNDNYPEAGTCMIKRCNTHVWAGESVAYVYAVKMIGEVPGLGLVLTKGAIRSYEISERSREKGMSNSRGVISLNPENFTLKPGATYTLSWRIFAHRGWEDFKNKIISQRSVFAKADKYVCEKGETANLTFFANHELKNPKVYLNGIEIALSKEAASRSTIQYATKIKGLSIGHNRVELVYDGNKKTYTEFYRVSNIDSIIARRAQFIINKQQLHNPADSRDGAYMVYDNEVEKIYLNDTRNANPVDRDEARERLGMGVLLAMLYNHHPDETIKNSLLKYADFVHKLQDKNYNTFSNTNLNGWNRNYNYSWVANYYFEMFGVTGNKQFLLDGYYTMKALFRNFGHSFYAIGMPIKGYYLLKYNGYETLADTLRDDFVKVANAYLKNGYNYPQSEVNYEQSIVAPSIIHLLQVYLMSKDKKYLDGAKTQLPLLEAFGGFQPTYHLNDISIRHWDGYWFGKREFWGDVFPHYWSTLTAVAYSLYADCMGDLSYKNRAQNIVRNNLCLFTEDGRGSCAYIYPYKVNGEQAQFFDPYANDQDWALVYYLSTMK